MSKRTRRDFISWFVGAATVATLAAGCGESADKTEGTTVENPQDIQDALNKSSAGYEAEKKTKKK